ncbi:hypothetical protein [Sebaldella termitidis]|uniref:hypothetical protein n=1 Tax=Sebaldella termitidis TaxID=826 RepID=UPI003EBD80E4
MKNKGSSLLYVLIILSVLSVFLTGFIFFTKNRYKILNLNSAYSYDLKIKLAENEKAFSDSIYKSGILIAGNKISLNNKHEYYNSGVAEDSTGKTNLKRLLYFKQNEKSTGGFNITDIKDQNGNSYHLPLKENMLYPDLIIIYGKNILNENISAAENIKFIRKNNDEINIETISFYFEGE